MRPSFSTSFCSVGRQRRLWEDTIRMNLKETEWDAMEWTHLPKDRYKSWADMNMIINRWVPQNMDFMNLRVSFRVFVTEPNGYFNAVTSQESAWLRSEQSGV